jgi:hypothetical protein
MLITVTASDIGQAAVIAWDVVKVAAGEDAAAWDMARASAQIRPEDKARLTAPRHRVAVSTAWFPVAPGGYGWVAAARGVRPRRAGEGRPGLGGLSGPRSSQSPGAAHEGAPAVKLAVC